MVQWLVAGNIYDNQWLTLINIDEWWFNDG